MALGWAKLNGVARPAKARQAMQQFQVENREACQTAIAARWKAAVTSGTKRGRQKPSFRQKVVRDMFAKLTNEEREAYTGRAKSEAEAAKAEFLRVVKAPPSQDPVNRAK